MRRLILLFALVAPVILVVLLWRAPWTGLGILFVSHMLILYPTLRPNVQWLGPVITRFETNAKEVWLTIDDGPTSDTRALLDLLDARGVKATFFVKGNLVDDSVREIVARGHTIGNHSHTHPSGTFWCLPPGRIEAEIEQCNAALGGAPRWFRAPVGMKNPFVHPALDRRGMRLIGWTVRGFDAVRDDADAVVARIVSHLEPGAILVLHQGREWSLRTIARVIDAVRERGYAFVVPDDVRLKTKR